MSKLIIVESPAKAKTIKNFLGSEYVVIASKGHIRDLPKSSFGIKVDGDKFTPEYRISSDHSALVKEIKTLASKADEIYLATDEDREGEAIAYHIATAIGKKPETLPRIVFHEITKTAIEAALANPRVLDMNSVNAQQARRLLDRIVGYKLSPLLNIKIQRGLSAGRVQSAALKILVDKEREIRDFKPIEYFSIDTKFKKDLEAELVEFQGSKIEKLTITNPQRAEFILNILKNDKYLNKCLIEDNINIDDIINFTIKIFNENPDILNYYSSKFKYVLVDEYQDTNKAQFMLVSLLAARYGNITVVGDNDQGIYSFRGADISNILNFEKDFPGTKIIKLEQNYRCTKNILNVANAVIKNNEVKYDKKLWTQNEEGNLPEIHQLDDEYDEARFIVEQINHLKREEYFKYSDFAVLYRMNTQSRAIEEILVREDIPYKIVGGLKFYERKEIKDIIAYLRLIHNTNDNLSLTRIINEPKRGIGKTSLDNVAQVAAQNGTSMYEVIKNAESYGLNRVYANSREFIQTIEELRGMQNEVLISELIKDTLNKTGYTKALETENTIEAENRIENLEEFLTVAIEFEEQAAENTLAEFLESITLSSDIYVLKNLIKLILLVHDNDYEVLFKYCYTSIARSFLFNKCDEEIFEVFKNNNFKDTDIVLLAKEVSSKIVFMDEGVLAEQGTPTEIFENPQNEHLKRFININF